MSPPAKNPKLAVHGDRLWTSLMELARIGATPKGGVCRLALTDLDRQGRDLHLEAGCNVLLHAMLDRARAV